MDAEDINVGETYWVNWVDTLPEQMVAHEKTEHFVVFQPMNKKGYVNVNIRRVSAERPYVSDEYFDNWWENGGGTSENCFHWYAANHKLVKLKDINDSESLAQAIKKARYKQVTGCSWEKRK